MTVKLLTIALLLISFGGCQQKESTENRLICTKICGAVDGAFQRGVYELGKVEYCRCDLPVVGGVPK